MSKIKTAVVGIGATGTVLSSALVSRDPNTILVAPRPEARDHLAANGLTVTGVLSYKVPTTRVVAKIADVARFAPDAIFLCTKTFNLTQVLDEISVIYRPGMKIISAHNGLGPEDAIADRFGPDAALRMSLNYGATAKGPGEVEVAFFNKPNPLGAVSANSREIGSKLADQLTAAGLDTAFVDDIKLHVWKKMIMKCTMASICAVTDRTIQDALAFPPTREIAETCFREVLAVAKAMGYDLGEGHLKEMLGYLEKVGVHKDSMCHDIVAKRPTEIDYLGGKVVEYGKQTGVPTPAYMVMTNLVKAVEDSYLGLDGA